MGDGTSQYALVDALNADWQRVVRDSAQVVAGWRLRHPALAAATGLDGVLDAVRSEPDAILGALLVETRTGCLVAPRVVLQAMLGKMVRMARSDAVAGVDDYVAVLWCEVVTYPLEARPRHIAANLALDTLKAVQAEHRWLVRGEVTPWPPDEHLDEICTVGARQDRLDHGVTISVLDADRVLDAGERLGILDAGMRAAMATVYCEGLRGDAAARRLGASPAVVRQRCSRGVRRLTERAALLADVA